MLRIVHLLIYFKYLIIIKFSIYWITFIWWILGNWKIRTKRSISKTRQIFLFLLNKVRNLKINFILVIFRFLNISKIIKPFWIQSLTTNLIFIISFDWWIIMNIICICIVWYFVGYFLRFYLVWNCWIFDAWFIRFFWFLNFVYFFVWIYVLLLNTLLVHRLWECTMTWRKITWYWFVITAENLR